MPAYEIAVRGRVQGVNYRAFTQQAATALAVHGWVRNEPDGTVLLHAEGEDEDVDALVVWCHDGPGFARVQDVAVREAAPSGATSFDITG